MRNVLKRWTRKKKAKKREYYVTEEIKKKKVDQLSAAANKIEKKADHLSFRRC
jgi:hypothetical protein